LLNPREIYFSQENFGKKKPPNHSLALSWYVDCKLETLHMLWEEWLRIWSQYCDPKYIVLWSPW